MIIAVGIVLLLSGLALISWAMRNPKWQGSESYDALVPFVMGCLALVLSLGICFSTIANRFG